MVHNDSPVPTHPRLSEGVEVSVTGESLAFRRFSWHRRSSWSPGGLSPVVNLHEVRFSVSFLVTLGGEGSSVRGWGSGQDH